MHLKSLLLENWGCHSRLNIDFGSGLQIEGRNGTGKSTILEAIRFVYTPTARGYNQKIKNGERQSTVKLEFIFDKKTNVVEKTVYVDKPSTASMVVDGVRIADNPTSVYERMKQIMPETVFEKLLYIPQGGLTSILDRLSGKDGKEEMDKLFGLDKLEKVWVETGQELRVEKGKQEVLDSQIKLHPEDALQQYEKTILETGEKILELQNQTKALEIDIEKASNKLKAKDDEINAFTAKAQRLRTIEEHISKSKVEEANTAKDIDAINQKEKDLTILKSELRKISLEKEGLERYKKINDALNELSSVDERIADKRLDEIKKKLEEYAEKTKDWEKVESEYKTFSSAVEKLNQKYLELVAELKSIAERIKDMSSVENEALCPKCGQRINRKAVEGAIREMAFDVSVLDGERKAKETVLTEAMESLEKAKVEVERLRDLVSAKRHLEIDYESRKTHVKELEERKAKLTDELEKNSYSGEDMRTVGEKIANFQRLLGRIEKIAHDITSLENAISTKQDKEKSLSTIKERILLSEKERANLGVDFEFEKKLRHERNTLSEMKYQLDIKLNATSSDSRRLTEQKTDIEKKLKEYTQLKEKIDSTNERIKLLDEAREIFHRDRGIARYLRENYIGRLNRLLSMHFKTFNENPRYSDVKFDSEYKIILTTSSGTLDSKQLSGGELVQLALALRMSLMDLMSPIRLLILDEPFGSLDEKHRELLGSALNKIAGTGQLIIVSHIQVESLQLENKIDLGGY